MSRRRILNPWNVVAFYDEYYTDLGCPIFSPTDSLPPFQLPMTTSATTYSWAVIDDAGTVTDLASGDLDQVVTSGNGSFLIYDGGNLASTLDDGTYRIQLNEDNNTYYSHPICCDRRFNGQGFTITSDCQTTSGINFVLTLEISNPDVGDRQWEVNWNDTGYIYVSETSARTIEIDTQDFQVPVDENITIDVRITITQGDFQEVRVYEFELFTGDPCGSLSGSLEDKKFTSKDRFQYIQFGNSFDFKDLNLYYQDGWQQRFYFEDFDGYGQGFLDETFLENEEGDQFLDSTTIAEVIEADVWPLPPYLVPVLTSVRIHDDVRVYSAYEGNFDEIEDFNFSTRTTENDPCLIGRMEYQINRSFVGCHENFDTE